MSKDKATATPTEQHSRAAKVILAKREGKPAPKEAAPVSDGHYDEQAAAILKRRGITPEDVTKEDEKIEADFDATVDNTTSVDTEDLDENLPTDKDGDPDFDEAAAADDKALGEVKPLEELTKKELKKLCDAATPPIEYHKKATNETLIGLLTA